MSVEKRGRFLTRGSRSFALTSPHRDRYLDYLRALAIIPVMLAHDRVQLMPGGSLGVNIFFVLSGYFIAKQLLQERPAPELAVSFLIRRNFRILPPYFFVLVLCFVLVHLTGGEDARFWRAFVLISPPHATGYRMGFFWTLQVEFWFYVFAPLIFLPLRKHTFLLFASLVFIFTVSVLLSETSYASAVRPYMALGTLILYANNFAIGGLCAAISCHVGGPIFSERQSALVMVIGLAIVAWCLTVDAHAGGLLRTYGTIIAIGTGLCVLTAPSHLAKSIWLPGMAYVGLISYSLYLVHLPLLDYFSQGVRFGANLGGWGISRGLDWYSIGGYFAVCIVVASVTYFAIERPSQRLARQITSAHALRKSQPEQQPAV